MGIDTTSVETDNYVKEKIQQINQIVRLPMAYQSYNSSLLNKFHEIYKISSKARWAGIDPNIPPESEITIDIADRVSAICNPQTEIPINDRLRTLLKSNRQEIVALKISEEIARGNFGDMEPQELLRTAIRVGLAVITEGVTIAPIQGLNDVTIRENRDGTKYACLFFSGPMRAAGGTESGLTVVIADHVRKVMSLSTYQPYSMGDDEPERILEELRIYERHQSFQFKVSDDSILETVRRLPVEINGMETEPGLEVVTHRIRNDKRERITTNGLRGGPLRVLNDGIIGRNKKLSKLIKELKISGWDWLEDIQLGKTDETNNETKNSHFKDVISGRAVLSVPEIPGGFRLRYGRSFNTGHATIGIHPASSAILGYPIVVGTQVKTNLPGKASTIAFVDSIEGPRVILKDGSLVQIQNQQEAEKLQDKVERIVYLGDVLISYGDFLENNYTLHKSAYVEEIWLQDVHKQWLKFESEYPELVTKIPVTQKHQIDFKTALEISQKLKVPLHPKFLFYWDRLSTDKILYLKNKLQIHNNFIRTVKENETKKLLELAGIPHQIQTNTIIITEEICQSIIFCLDLKNTNPIKLNNQTPCELLSAICGIQIKEKSAISVGMRVGRPEKATLRKMKPAVQNLFPINKDGGLKSDIIVASKLKNSTKTRTPSKSKNLELFEENTGKISIDIINSYCKKCNVYDLNSRCSICNNPTELLQKCPRCNVFRDVWKCPKCKIQTQTHSRHLFDLAHELEKAIQQVKYHPKPPLKGVAGLFSKIKYPEPLTKGILRNKYNLFTYRDGTIRFDLTNAPLTHANAKMINITIEKLNELGYTHDIHRKPIKNENQIFELYIQDIIISDNAAQTMVEISKFIDDLLIYVYKTEPCYKFQDNTDLLGELIVGLAPHTSVGVVGRIIGFTDSQVCFAHPYWHSAKRRDCDGDGDSIILLADVLLNFSKEYLPDTIGGLMDAPFLLQPVVLPKEVQRQARNLDVTNEYPKEFYDEIINEPVPVSLKAKIQTTEEFVLSGSEKQFIDFHFTHTTSDISTGPKRTSYTTDKDINMKIDKQLNIAKKIDAVDPNQVVKALIKTHLIPDIIGNTRAYLSQSFRCKNKFCGEKIPRMPLNNRCFKCKSELKATVTRGSALKYLPLAVRLSNEYDVGDYIKNRIELLVEEAEYIFPSNKDKSQTELTAFV